MPLNHDRTMETAIDILRDLLKFHETEVLRLRMSISLLDGTVTELHEALEHDKTLHDRHQYKITAVNTFGEVKTGLPNAFEPIVTEQVKYDTDSETEAAVEEQEVSKIKAVVKDSVKTVYNNEELVSVENLPDECDSRFFTRHAKKYRERKGKTLYEVGTACDCHYTYVSTLERGLTNNFSLIKKLSSYYGIKITEYVVGGSIKRKTNKREVKTKSDVGG